ncbi:MAG: phenylpropionate dioxygenase-like ring-hydroxylating dioxygenase large terminal subunit [Verrucomicrobiales bacterium]|jgi:phenylpropionate dioxygenase-like ring-hydroxylating dioxygenase large terminal subunit
MNVTDTIHDEWFPVAMSASVQPGSMHPFELLGQRYILLSDSDGAIFVTVDTCPHRGAQLSLGNFDGTRLQCGYHGWEFAGDGQCVNQPAHPGRTPSLATALQPVAVLEQYGFWWVCAGNEPKNVPSFPSFAEPGGASLVIDAARVDSSGPRIVENFLDQAHFPYIHADYLGQIPHTAIDRYGVDIIDDELHLTNCVVWQPNPGPRATTGGPVHYDYSVSHPYAATLTKVPSDHDGGELGGFSILLIASPINETSCNVWRVVTVVDADADLVAQREFNRTIFEQDVPIVESQRPKLLPVSLQMEKHQPADAGSLAYRKWLVERGTRYGTIRTES